MYKRQIVGISMGDPFGNGPEISVRIFQDPKLHEICRPVIIGDAAAMEYAATVQKKLSGFTVKIRPIHAISEAEYVPGVIDVYDLSLIHI